MNNPWDKGRALSHIAHVGGNKRSHYTGRLSDLWECSEPLKANWNSQLITLDLSHSLAL